MNILLEYENGRMKELDTSTLVQNDSVVLMSKPQGRSMATEFDLRLDLLEAGQGLRLDVWWHNTIVSDDHPVKTDLVTREGKPVDMPHAVRRPGYSILIANPTTMEQVSKVSVHAAGETQVVAWRQGGGRWLILGEKARATLRGSYLSGEHAISEVNENAFHLMQDQTKLGDRDIVSVCEAFGYPVDAYQDLLVNRMKKSLESAMESDLASDEIMRQFKMMQGDIGAQEPAGEHLRADSLADRAPEPAEREVARSDEEMDLDPNTASMLKFLNRQSKARPEVDG